MSAKPEEAKNKPEEQPVVAEETKPEEPVKAEEEKKEEPSPALTALLDMLKKEKPPLTLADKHISSHYRIDNLKDFRSMKVMADVWWLVKEEMLLDSKLTLEKIIEMGERCPCAKHNGARRIAEFIQMHWIGEA